MAVMTNITIIPETPTAAMASGPSLPTHIITMWALPSSYIALIIARRGAGDS
jgi:hypothetical protein